MKVLLAVLAAILTIVIGGIWQWTRLPSDATLRHKFKQSQEDLERLRQLAKDDYLYGRVHAAYVDQKTLSAERLTEYRRLMKAVGIQRIWANGPGLPIEFLFEAYGILDTGTYKGISYAAEPEGLEADSLDNSCMGVQRSRTGRFCHVVHRLDGNWWLFRYEYH